LLGPVIGIAAGFVFRLQGGERKSAPGGILAGLLAASFVFVAAFAVPAVQRPRSSVEEQLTDEAMIVSAAVQLAEQWVMEGREPRWPEGSGPDSAAKPADFPPELWNAALCQWRMTPPSARECCREMRKANLLRLRDESSNHDLEWLWRGLGGSVLAGFVATTTCILGKE
jgi:hypothetical protein